jgi:hypothetical protein
MASPTCAGWPAQRGGDRRLGPCAAGAELIERLFHPIHERVERASVLLSAHRPAIAQIARYGPREQDLTEHGLHRHERREPTRLAAEASARCGGAKPQPNQRATADRLALQAWRNEPAMMQVGQ